MGIDNLGIDIMGVDILGIDVPAPIPLEPPHWVPTIYVLEQR